MKKKYVFGVIMLTVLMMLNLGIKINDESVSITGKAAYALQEKKEAKCVVCPNGIKIECIEGGIGTCTPINDCVAGTCGES